MSMYIILIIEFFKTGLFAVGGGLATVPFLMEIARKYDFLSIKELTNMIAISESTPGPIGVNTATYVGFNTGGFLGALISTLALVLPSYIIICIISIFLKKYNDSKYVQSAFLGIRPVVIGIILNAVLQILQITLLKTAYWSFDIDKVSTVLVAGYIILMFLPKLKKIHPILWILSGAVIGIIFKL